MITNDGFSIFYGEGATDSQAIALIRDAMQKDHPEAYARLIDAECRFQEAPLLFQLSKHGAHGLAALASALRGQYALRFNDSVTLPKP